jgi:large subunit ribosomal protein L33
MSKVCEISGKRVMFGNNVSKALNRTKRRFDANIIKKRFFIPERKGRLQRLNTMAKKGNRVQVILECTEHKESGLPGTSRYITTKNKKNSPERLEIKKFNPILKKMTVHKEIK